MKLRIGLVLASLALGALASGAGADTREVLGDRLDRIEMTELYRRGRDIEAADAELRKRAREIASARTELEADTAAVMSNVRLRHGITDAETFGYDLARNVFTVAAVTTSPPAASR